VVFIIAHFVTALGLLHMIVFIVMIIYNCYIPEGMTSVCQYNEKKPIKCPLNVPQILRLQYLEHNTMLSGLPVTKCVCVAYI